MSTFLLTHTSLLNAMDCLPEFLSIPKIAETALIIRSMIGFPAFPWVAEPQVGGFLPTYLKNCKPVGNEVFISSPTSPHSYTGPFSHHLSFGVKWDFLLVPVSRRGDKERIGTPEAQQIQIHLFTAAQNVQHIHKISIF